MGEGWSIPSGSGNSLALDWALLWATSQILRARPEMIKLFPSMCISEQSSEFIGTRKHPAANKVEFRMFGIPPKSRGMQRGWEMSLNEETKQSLENDPKMAQMLESPEKDLKTFSKTVVPKFKMLSRQMENR